MPPQHKDMSIIAEQLLSSKLFSCFKRDELNEVFPLLNLRVMHHKKGEVLLHKDDIADYVGILLAGELAVQNDDIYGTSHLIRKVFPLQIFAADIASTPTQISPYIVTCINDATVAAFPFYLLSKKSSLPDEYRCAILNNILCIISNHSIRQHYKTEILTTKSLRERIILYLSHQAKRHDSLTFEISLNREEMAAYLCVDRSALSRELARMQKERLLRFKKNAFCISSELVPF